MANENESEAVRTTIVGARPPGSGRGNVAVPRGIEVLVKKAAVDAEFRELLLSQRGKAASGIALELDPAERAILDAIPREQLARIVDQTEVATELRPAFAGRVGAVMLAALGAGLVTIGLAKPTGLLPDQIQGAAPAPRVSTSDQPLFLAQGQVTFGNTGALITNRPPANPRLTNLPLTNLPPTPNRPPPIVVRGIQPSLPPTNSAAANLPATNPAAPSTDRGPGARPKKPGWLIFRVPQPGPPKTNAPQTNPPAKNPEERARGKG